MTTVHTPELRCRVFTEKEGALSSLGHALEFVFDQGALTVAPDETSVNAYFEATSLRVVNATGSDAEKIERIARDEVLNAKKFPLTQFASSKVQREDGDYVIHGKLSLHGVERPIVVRAHREADRLICRFELRQPDHGIRPYSAMLGALRVAPMIAVEVSVPAR